MRRHASVLALVLFALLLVLSACGSTEKDSSKLAPVSQLPQAMRDAQPRVRTAYQFAVANPEALRNVPCYCGCGSMGHTSNLSCYLTDQQPAGGIAFDEHALGCSLCVDITQDVMRLTDEGKDPETIHDEVVAAYSQFGPGNQ